MPKDAEWHRMNRQRQKEELAKERAEAVREGVRLACNFMRKVIAGKALTGYQSAVSLEKQLLFCAPAEVEQRRKLVKLLQDSVTATQNS